jgi:hypothetical protein
LPAILVFSVMVLWICGRLPGIRVAARHKSREHCEKRGQRWMNSAERLEIEEFRVNSSLK